MSYAVRRFCPQGSRPDCFEVFDEATGKCESFPMRKKDAEITARRMNEGASAICGPSVEKVVDANYRIAKPYGGGILSTPKRYMLTQDEHDAIAVMSEACDEFPALRALAAWAEENGAPEPLREALAAARQGARWAVEGRPAPEGHKPYRTKENKL